MILNHIYSTVEYQLPLYEDNKIIGSVFGIRKHGGAKLQTVKR